MNLRGRTLRARVVRSTAVVSTLAMIAMIGTVMLVLTAVSSNAIDTTLDDRLDAVSATVSLSNDGTVKQLETPDDNLDDSTWVFSADGHVVDAPRAGQQVTAAATALAHVTSRTREEHHDRVYLAAPILDESGKRQAVVVVSESIEPYEATRAAVLILLSSLGVLVIAGSAAIAAWTMRRALVPVEVMAANAEDWSEHSLDTRFEISDDHDEIGRLAGTLNLLLDRVAGALRSEQRLTSEVAHELRTPLTTIRGEAELVRLTVSDAPTAERLGRIVELVDQMTNVITTLVELARGGTDSGSRALSTDVIDAVLGQAPTPPGITVAVHAVEPVMVAAPVDVVARALAPLVENASRYARTSVTITVRAGRREAEFIVEDDGPGISDADIARLFIAGSRDADSSGAGLGLPLSRRVARSLGGDVVLTSSSEPTRFTVTLPLY